MSETIEINKQYYSVVVNGHNLNFTTNSVPEDDALGPRDFGILCIQSSATTQHPIVTDKFGLYQHFTFGECTGFSVVTDSDADCIGGVITAQIVHNFYDNSEENCSVTN